MALTLVEAAKGETDAFRRGIIEAFMDDQRLLQRIPFREISGGHDGQLVEAVLPDAQTRGVNQAFTANSLGRIDEIVQALKIYGGEVGIDPFILETKGVNKAAAHIALKVKAISNRWVLDFFKGDQSADLRDFDGLQLRLDGFNVLSAGATADGAILSLAVLDEAIMRCNNPQALLVGRQMAIRFTQAQRSTAGAATNIRAEKNDFGRQALFYNDLEIIVVTDNSNNDNILDFTEAADSGDPTASSIYVASFGEDQGIDGFQNGGIRVRGLGESEEGSVPVESTRIEWYNNFQIGHPRGVIRLRDVLDAPFVT